MAGAPLTPSPWIVPASQSDDTIAFRPAGAPPALVERSWSFATALRLVIRTAPYGLVRLGVLLTASTLTIIWLAITFGGGAWLGAHVANVFGFAWIVLCLGSFGFAWHMILRYALHLISCGHVAVLTELITRGQIGNGTESMFAYGRRVVVGRIGQESLLFGLTMTVRGIIDSFHRTLDGIAEGLSIPGLESLANLATMVVRGATRYLDKVIFSYALARPDRDAWTAAREGLIYYAQNAKPILKTSIWIMLLERAVTVLLWLGALVPAAAIVVLLPHSLREMGALATLVVAALVAGSIRGAFIKPIFLTMIIIRFHAAIENQLPDPVWDARLAEISGGFAGLGSQLRV